MDYFNSESRLILLTGLLLATIPVLAKELVEIDLRQGIVRGYSSHVTFLQAPKPSRNNKCDAQAVIRIDFSGPIKTAKLSLEYDRPRLWTLDISDSPAGDGYGGDNGTTSNMAETQIYNKQMRIYGNSLPGYLDATIDGGLLLKVVDDIMGKNKKVYVGISDEKIEWSERQSKQFIESKFLYTLSGQNTTYGDVDYHVYVGLNRVVAGNFRHGFGLCKVTITLQEGGVDKCRSGNNDCHRNANCFNTRRSFRCRCKQGFYGNGKICIDEDECEYENGGCVHNCKNSQGNFSCSCKDGFLLASDGFNCIDKNECFYNRSGCMHQCINTLGSFQCKCKSGYSLNQDGRTCSATPWCKKQLGCEHHCKTGSRGSRCDCRQGYKLHSNGKNCIATCAIGNGGCQHRCTDISSGPLCSCHDKYILTQDGHTCIASCGVNNGGCDRKCKDTPGGPVCSCPLGYNLHHDNKSCLDVDECIEENGGCSHGCINTHGSFECICPKGFKVQHDQKTCQDVDECSVKDICDHSCANTPGSFQCHCHPGYQSYGITHCADQDECSMDNGGCEHSCENSQGNYACSCRTGHKLHPNGKDCVEAKCLSLQAPPKASMECSTQGADHRCKLACKHRAQFHLEQESKFTFHCGPSTNYMWSHELENRTLPTCSETLAAPGFKRKAQFVFFANQCSLKRRTKHNFQQDLNQALGDILKGMKKLRCPELCQVGNISLQCGSKRHKFNRMSRRTGQTVIRAEFELTVNPQPATKKCDVDCIRKRTEKRLKRSLKALRKSINKEQFFVRLDGQSYSVTKKSLKATGMQQICPSGHILSRHKCVACSAGTHWVEGDQCTACPPGQYQDEEGQTRCKVCPHGKAGVGPRGASTRQLCDAQCEPGTFSDDGFKPCESCPRGTYQPGHGHRTCRSCGRGTQTRDVASTSFQNCVVKSKCSRGWFFNRDKDRCQMCPKDTYQPEPGLDFCITCPGNTTTDMYAATNHAQCKDHSCRGHIGEFQGFIQSPNWPGDYPMNVECTWTIEPEKGRRILVIIPEIFLASQDKCGDVLVMRKSESPYSRTTFETCESTETPIAFTGRSKKLWIQFKTNKRNSASGFSIPYVTYNEEYQDLIEDIVRDGRLYSSHQHQEVLKDRKLLSALLEVIAQPYNYFKYANVSHSMFPESFIRLLTPKVRRFFT